MRNVLHSDMLKFNEMLLGGYAFYWKAPIDGFQLLKEGALSPAKANKVDSIPPWLALPATNTQTTAYAPLNIAGLHRKFGSLHGDKSIIEFANRYGFLGKDVMLTPQAGGAVILGESLERWRLESRTMGMLLAIWDMVRGEDAGKLGQIIIWRSPDEVLLQMSAQYDDDQKRWLVTKPKPGFADETQLASRIYKPELLERWKVGMLIEPARYHVFGEVNKQLKGHVSPQVFPFIKNKIYLWPDTLLAALWVLFLMELTDTTTMRKCDRPGCQEWKVVKITRGSFFCSDACRMKVWRNSNKQAKRSKKVKPNERPHNQEIQE